MDGRAFLEVARELLQGATEAHRRAAAGRAYYALMLESRELLERWAVPCPRNDVHRFVKSALLGSADPLLKGVGLLLGRLGEIRTKADYELSDPIHLFARAKPVETLIQDTGKAIALLDEIDNDDIRRAAAIESLRRK